MRESLQVEKKLSLEVARSRPMHMIKQVDCVPSHRTIGNIGKYHLWPNRATEPAGWVRTAGQLFTQNETGQP
jgi:hypothetical protein